GRGFLFRGLRRCLLGLGLGRSVGRFRWSLLGLPVRLLGGLLRRRRCFGGFLRLDRGFDFLAAHFADGDLGLVEQEIDHLVLIQRRPQLGLRHGVAGHVIGELLTVFLAVLLRRLA